MTRIFILLALLLMFAGPVAADEGAAAPEPQKEKAVASDALDQPVLDDKAIVAFAAGAASDVMTFDHRNFQQRFLDATPRFSKGGWQSFSAQLKNSGTFENLRKQGLTLTAEPASPPVIKEKGVVDGKYRWLVDFPLTVHYKSSDNEHDETLKLHLTIHRVPSADNAEGVQITQWEAQ